MIKRGHLPARRRLMTIGVLVATCVVAGCGGGSSSSSSTSTSANQTASANGGNGSFAGRRAAIASCLKKQGLSVPQRPGGPGAGRGFFFGGGDQANNPQRAKIRAALQKCGINFSPGQRRFNPATNPAYRTAVENFTACVRKDGYNLPAPNLSGHGPVFDPSKVSRSDPAFTKAASKCAGLLRFRPRSSSGGQNGASA